MIDLSHLTDEEQGVIMTVLRRDAALKKAEEERVRKLEAIKNGGSRPDSRLKYLTGEWFYEAKSRRHMDKIHGSEIILASMKQRKGGGLDGSPRIERFSQVSNIVAPAKPARCLEAIQPQEMNDAEKENMNSAVRSPRTPRHNPFNRASLIVVEPTGSAEVLSKTKEEQSPDAVPRSQLKHHRTQETGQTSGGSVTSEGSSAGFRPVPKKRTFLSRRSTSQSESDGPGSDPRAASAVMVPAPRWSNQQGSSGSSNQSCQRGHDEMPQSNIATVSTQAQSSQPYSSADGSPEQPVRVSSVSSPERDTHPPTLPSDKSVADTSDPRPPVKPSAPSLNSCNFRHAAFAGSDASTSREVPQKSVEGDGQREPAAARTVTPPAGSSRGSQVSGSVLAATRQEEPSLTSTAGDEVPPVSYDLNFIDSSDQQTQKRSSQKHAFKLSTQTSNPHGDEDDSIAKVLDWFNRSTDSSDWLDAEDGPEATKSSSRHDDINKLGREESLRRDAGTVEGERMKATRETKRSHSQRQTEAARDRKGKKELTKMPEEVKKDTRERKMSQEGKNNPDENQSPKISQLKSFWEKSNTYPKIISKSLSPSDKEQRPDDFSAETDEANESEPNNRDFEPDSCLTSGMHNGKGIYEKHVSNQADQNPSVGPQRENKEDGFVNINNSQELLASQTSINDQTYNSDHLKFAAGPQMADREGSDTDGLSGTRLDPLQQRRPSIGQISLSLESHSISPVQPNVQPNAQPDTIFQAKETSLLETLSASPSLSHLDADLQAKDNPDLEKLHLSRNSPHADYKQGGSEAQTAPKTQMLRGSSEDLRVRDGEDKGVQSTMSPKWRGDASNKDRTNSPHGNRQNLAHQDSVAERIKQLKSFWEQERNKPIFYTSKPKSHEDAKGARSGKLSKRFTKSEYDLRSIASDSGANEDASKCHLHSTLPPNQRLDKLSPSLGTSRAQFNTLRDFWDEATSDSKGSFSSEKPKSPKRKEQINAQLPPHEVKCGDPELHHLSPIKPPLGSGPRPATDRKNSLTAEPGQHKESRRSSKDSGREEKATKPQSNLGKETRSPKSKKDSFGNSSSRGGSLRRATSMFSLNGAEETDKGLLKIEISPVHSQSRRQSTEKGAMARRGSEDSEALAPRARAFVPRDYRHYLGMTDETSVRTPLAPAAKDDASQAFDLSGPVRASTPVSSEERYVKKGGKTNQHPLWASYSSSDTGQESSVSSTSEAWSSSRTSSNQADVNDLKPITDLGNSEKDDDDQNPIRRALRRAEARPKNLAKSMEDITGSLSPRQERGQDPAADMRRVSDASSIPSPSSSLFSDPEHLKNMSKSVPSFLQKEDDGGDTDSTCGDSERQRKLTKGSSMSNLTSSSGMASVSSLSGSVMTMYSGDFGTVEVQGNIQFSINYIQRLREFHIFVAECRDLAVVDPKRGRSDPYVKSYLVPDKANLGKRKTSVKKKTLNPAFNEILRYRVRMEYLRTQTLILSVWHHDTFGRNSFLGEVDVDLSTWDFDHTQMNDVALKARTTPSQAPSNGRGEMRLAVRFLPQIAHSEGSVKEGPTTGELHIWVKDCKNLPLIRATIDPYVKCFVLPDTSRKSRQKTRVLRRTADPVFNHTMVYDGIREVDLTEACVELTVWDRDRLASNLLGGLRLGAGTGRSYGALVDWMDSTPYEVALWERMVASPNEWVEDMLPLRMLNSAKAAFK